MKSYANNMYLRHKTHPDQGLQHQHRLVTHLELLPTRRESGKSKAIPAAPYHQVVHNLPAKVWIRPKHLNWSHRHRDVLDKFEKH